MDQNITKLHYIESWTHYNEIQLQRVATYNRHFILGLFIRCYGLFRYRLEFGLNQIDDYTVLYRKWTQTQISIPNHYYIHFWDGYPYPDRQQSPCPAM